MKITRRQLRRIIRESIATLEGGASLRARAAQEFAQLSPDDVDMINTPLTAIQPNLDLRKIFGQQDLEYIDVSRDAMEALQESLPQISELLMMLMGKDSESITGYIQSILVHAEFRADGSVLRRTFYRGGQKHRDGDLPAQISYDESGNVDGEVWYQNGVMHRAGDKPAAVHISPRGNIETYYKQGKRHREGDKPAVLAFDPAGKPREQMWYINGARHREGDNPTRIMRSKFGGVVEYKKNNKLHREGDLPAYIATTPDGKVREEIYYIKGEKHRDNNKPASILYGAEGEPLAWEFWTHDEEVGYGDSIANWNEDWRKTPYEII